eukprot:1284091-Amphidinium_carterae.1
MQQALDSVRCVCFYTLASSCLEQAIRAMTGATMPAGRAASVHMRQLLLLQGPLALSPDALCEYVCKAGLGGLHTLTMNWSVVSHARGATQSAANAASAASQHDHSTSWHGEIASQQSSSSSGARQMRDFSAHQNCSSAPVPWGEQPAPQSEAPP